MAKNSQGHTNASSKSITPAYTSTNTGERPLAQARNEVERITKNVFKDDFGRCSNQFTTNHTAEVFVEKSTGRTGFKEEIKYKSTVNFDDKVHGGSSKYETQLKFKKKVTFPPSQSGPKAALPNPNTYDYSTSENYYGTAEHSDEHYDYGDGAGTADDCGHDVDYDYHGGGHNDLVDYDNYGGGYNHDVDYGYSD